jgi:Uma2 family endonuclease
MATTSTRLTIDDSESLPYELPKNRELVDGEFVDVSGNTLEHNRMAGLGFTALWLFVREHGLGTVLAERQYDFGGSAHGPDISFLLLPSVLSKIRRSAYNSAMATVSANDSFKSLGRKKDRYRRCGTAEVWILSPESREIYVYAEQSDRVLRADAALSTLHSCRVSRSLSARFSKPSDPM